jgi:nucleoside-diphosphate-sugar epimerase
MDSLEAMFLVSSWIEGNAIHYQPPSPQLYSGYWRVPRYSVVTTVRSHEKAEQIRECHHLHASTTRLRVIIVPDFTSAGAFDECFKSDAPFDVVIHTASPFRYSVTDIQRELLDPAIGGTIALLEAVRKSAPSVKKVVRFPHRSEMKQTLLGFSSRGCF